MRTGVTVGFVGAAWTSGLLERFLFGVAPRDPVTFVAISGLLLATAALASWIPARRASRADPSATLREE